MAWKSGTIMDSRLEFVRLAQTVGSVGVSMAALCRRFGISRETGYKWCRRFEVEGIDGLGDRSRRPHRSPARTAPAMEERVLALREQHPWGGRKLQRRLRDVGVGETPAASTITAILRRYDKLDPAKAGKPAAFLRFERPAPNDLWQMDFKGHFATDSGRCHPLTVLDDHSRFALCVSACADETLETVRQRLSNVFRRYGLPRAMLTDNGSPWGGENCAFAVWLMRLGIEIAHGRPYHPQTQGKDERLHRTLVVELLQQPRRFADLAACQAGFDGFRQIYNHERPHDALALAVPASRYQVSPIPFPELLPDPQYYPADRVRRVRFDGMVSFQGRPLKLSQAYAGLDVAFRPSGTDGVWRVFFMATKIAELDVTAR
jgi:transposase InsO family protein